MAILGMTKVLENPTTIDPNEVEKFTKMADDWWNPNGKFRPLHKFNPTRLKFIRENVLRHFNRDNAPLPFAGLKLLDIGCGGGLLSEPMARLGADVTAIDATLPNIKTAQAHLLKSDIQIDYRHTTAEELLKTHAGKFDIVLNMEVIEHVANPAMFLQSAIELLAPGGIMFIATINRTQKAKMLAVFAAEKILRWLPEGTHDFEKLVKPQEILDALSGFKNLNIIGPIGVSYNPLFDSWALGNDTSMNYMMVVEKA